MSALEPFERNFRIISYLVSLCGLFALFISGGVGILVFSGFFLGTLLAWFLEDTKWQFSERVAVAIVALAVAGFFLDWQFHITGIWQNGVFAAAGLSRLILFLAAIKLLQRKTDKDWVFIYLISFFEVLLAAGLSISPLYLVSLFSYLLLTTCAVIAFEIRRSSRFDPQNGPKKETGIRRLQNKNTSPGIKTFNLPWTAIALLCAITIVALPVFFAFPRGNAAGFGGDLGNPINVTGFSDSVSLGTIGSLQKNDAIVMRVRIDQNNNDNLDKLLWRGVALDHFDNRTWKKSTAYFGTPCFSRTGGLISFDSSANNGKGTIQTFYLEPMSTDVLFALKRPFQIQGLKSVSRDSEGALRSFRNAGERHSYSVFSDTFVPDAKLLRVDDTPYSPAQERYLQMPDNMDPRIAALAKKYTDEAHAFNRLDAARAIEYRLQHDFKYSLDMKAGGEQPVADFLFNVKQGHCEYFASSMAMMLRTQGIAARVVNGFQSGDFNERPAFMWSASTTPIHGSRSIFQNQTAGFLLIRHHLQDVRAAIHPLCSAHLEGMSKHLRRFGFNMSSPMTGRNKKVFSRVSEMRARIRCFRDERVVVGPGAVCRLVGRASRRRWRDCRREGRRNRCRCFALCRVFGVFSCKTLAICTAS